MVNKDLKIEIRPIPNKNRIREFSENLEFFGPPTVIRAFGNARTYKYNTGLSKEDLEYLKEEGCTYDIDDKYTPKSAHPFWDDDISKTELRQNPSFLYPGRTILDFIKWKYLQVNNYIYKSEEEMLSGSKPQATHYIYNEDVENAVKATKIESRHKILRDVSELSFEKKRDILLIIEGEDTSNKKENYVTVKFEEILENKDKRALLESLIKEDSVIIDAKANIKKAINNNILRETKQGIFYGQTNLGYSLDDLVTFLTKPANQELYLHIIEKI